MFYQFSGLSLIMVLLMMKSVWPLLIESALILLQTVPTHIEVDTLKKKLLVIQTNIQNSLLLIHIIYEETLIKSKWKYRTDSTLSLGK